MKRNGLFIAVKMVVVGAFAGSLVACGGSGSGSGSADVASVSASSQGSSVGAVTGFGSVYVNGTRFATNGSVTSDDGIEREDQLHKGMVLKVRGSWDGLGEGRADDVAYDDTLRGPLASANWDGLTKTGQLEILGQTVELDRQTVFRGATPDELAAHPAGYRVRVSGWPAEDGVFKASYVGAKVIGQTFDGENDAEIEGRVANLDAAARTFTINGYNIDYQLAIGDEDFDLNNLANGMSVEVEGSLQGDLLMAKEIDTEDSLFDDEDDAEISGDLYGFDSSARAFLINGVPVQYDSDTEFDDISVSSLQDGIYLKVEGEFRNGVLLADEIEGKEGDAELSGRVQSIDLTNETLVVSGVRVKLSSGTLIEDDSDDRHSRVQDINAFGIGDYLEVEGRQRSADGGYLEAFVIEREDGDDETSAEIEARVDAISDTSITIMNLDILLGGFSAGGVQVGDDVEAEYQQNDGGEFVLIDELDD
ncbi:DUF5666 domain-containing protein [Marinobacter sp.]|uniref:DUF5666 domain-containing protein n=1 Tax=Marinobacter sp. TaxID=50741 RepID=UPI0035658090